MFSNNCSHLDNRAWLRSHHNNHQADPCWHRPTHSWHHRLLIFLQSGRLVSCRISCNIMYCTFTHACTMHAYLLPSIVRGLVQAAAPKALRGVSQSPVPLGLSRSNQGVHLQSENFGCKLSSVKWDSKPNIFWCALFSSFIFLGKSTPWSQMNSISSPPQKTNAVSSSQLW